MEKQPKIVENLKERGFGVEVREHQGYEDVVLAFTDALNNVGKGSSVQIRTQEGTQGVPCTIFDARKGDQRVIFTVSEKGKKPVTSNVVAINVGLVPAEKAVQQPQPP